MNTILNVCHRCHAIPAIKIKSNKVERKCLCAYKLTSFKDYIKLVESQLQIVLKRSWCYNSYPKIHHYFYPVKGYCNDCFKYFCEYCLNEHRNKYPSHCYFPFYIKTTIPRDYYLNEHDDLPDCFLYNFLHFCLVCDKKDDHILDYDPEVMNVHDFKYSFDYQTKLEQFYEYQHIMNELIKSIDKEYHSEFNKPQVQKAFQRFIERYTEFITVLQIQFDTYDIFHSQGRTNYPAMSNIIKNTKYLTDENTLLNYPFKIRCKDDLINFFNTFRFINEHCAVGEPSDYRTINLSDVFYTLTSVCIFDNNKAIFGMDNLNEIKITCLCQGTIQTLYVGFILKSGFTKH